MRKFTAMILSTLVLSFFFVAQGRAQGIKEGKWEMTMVTKMEGLSAEEAAAMEQMKNMPPAAMAMMQKMPGMNVQMGAGAEGITTTITECMTSKNPVPHMNDSDPADCKQSHDIDGNTVNFKVECNNHRQQMNSTGSVTYKDDAMEGTIKSHQVENGQAMDATIKMSGKYLGKCE